MVLAHGYVPPARAVAAIVSLAAASVADGQRCATQTVPDLGYQYVSCVGCLAEYARHEVSEPGYTAEPVVRQVDPNGPAAGKVMDGDTLISIDGIGIGTREAAVHLAGVRDSVRISLRRGGVVREVTILPGSRCVDRTTAREAGGAAGAAPMLQLRRELELFEQAAQMRRGAQGGWLGIGLRADTTAPSGTFRVAPSVDRVDPDSPASRAGLTPGMVLYAVDGESIRSAEGARRLASVQPGQRVLLSLQGDHGWVEVALTAEQPGMVKPATARLKGAYLRGRDSLVSVPRRTWIMDGVSVTTRGPGIAVVRDTTARTMTVVVGKDTIVIRSTRGGG
ncbi:MAG TPA: PDZ domain-containing protein [Gemmatimonadaceae bacterium]|nr:PDZ domain-containing protein [Gemmatimonadaceae bacterium]